MQNGLLELALQQGIWAAAFMTVGIFIFSFFKITINDLKKFQDRAMQKSEERENKLIEIIESFSNKFDTIEKSQLEMKNEINDIKEIFVLLKK